MNIQCANRIVPDGAPRLAASHLGLFCLPMFHKKDAKLILVKNSAYGYNVQNVVHSDPVTELLIIKHAIRDTDFTSSELKGYIHATYLDPFCASLYTEEQLKLAREHFKLEQAFSTKQLF